MRKYALGETALWPTPGGQKFWEPYSSKDVKGPGNHLDFVQRWTSPYVNAKWDAAGKRWVTRTPIERILGRGGPNNIKNATGSDEPGTSAGRKKKGEVAVDLELAVFCIDSQEVMGVLDWGITIPDNADKPIVVTHATRNDVRLNVSPDFKKLVARANEVGVSGNDVMDPTPMNHAQPAPGGGPKISKPIKNLVNGTPAL